MAARGTMRLVCLSLCMCATLAFQAASPTLRGSGGRASATFSALSKGFRRSPLRVGGALRMGGEEEEKGSSRRAAIGRGFAALGGAVAWFGSSHEAIAGLTPLSQSVVNEVVPGMKGTEINGQLIDANCQGSRGNRCNVWQPPAVEDSPSAEDASAGKRGTVTSKAYLDVRIITDYTNEVLEDGVKRGRIVLGLYGNEAPKTVAEFLKFIKADDSYPSYKSGMFYKHEAGKWIEGGRINGLTQEEFAGDKAYQFLGKLLNLKPILEVNDLTHSRKGLITHYKFNPGPEFAFTTAPSPGQDGAWTVFGEVLEGMDVVKAISDLPFVTGKSLDPNGSMADGFWQAQNKYFLGLAKQLGDSRVGNKYPGKLLRRVEIVACGVL